MKKRLLFGVLIVVFVIGTCAISMAKDPKVYKVGGIMAMTGSGAWYGKVMSQGILLAMEEFNSKGGVDGIKLKLLLQDHESGKGAAAVSGFLKLVNIDKIPFSFTSYSTPTLSIVPIAKEKKVLLLNGGGVSPRLVKQPYLFNNRMLAMMQGGGVLMRAKELGFKRMAVLYWNDDAGIGTQKYVAKRWKAMGGEITAAEAHAVGATDYKPYLSKVIASNPDFLALWSWGKDWGITVKQAREMGFTKPILGIEYSPDAHKIAGETAEGYEFVTDAFNPEGGDAWTNRFVASYTKRYGEAPEKYAANYYEGTYILAALIKAAKAEGGDYWKGDRLMKKLVEIKNFPSIYGGQVVFNPEEHTCIKPTALFKIVDGKKTFVKYLEM
ncbi:MAG: ABC transporter substrate-binding protein [Deltaproteobacteria bacterium]|nr:ABC transporter substrate-binding protein [Deltaproteobacteria bacterium]MBW2285083.1 ABC transporter substrate-binding protein [Deltaproteobacteria bacterium]